MKYPYPSIINAGMGAIVLIWCGHGCAGPNAATALSGMMADRALVSSRICMDMDGHLFGWEWGNAPFASSCTDDDASRSAPSASETAACYFDCSNRSLGCLTSILDGRQPKVCSDDLAACMSGCKGGSDAAMRNWLGETP